MPFGILKVFDHYDVVYFISEELSLTVWAWGSRNNVGGKGWLIDWLTELINELMTKVFVEQPLALPGSANNLYLKTFLFHFLNIYQTRVAGAVL